MNPTVPHASCGPAAHTCSPQLPRHQLRSRAYLRPLWKGFSRHIHGRTRAATDHPAPEDLEDLQSPQVHHLLVQGWRASPTGKADLKTKHCAAGCSPQAEGRHAEEGRGRGPLLPGLPRRAKQLSKARCQAEDGVPAGQATSVESSVKPLPGRQIARMHAWLQRDAHCQHGCSTTVAGTAPMP